LQWVAGREPKARDQHSRLLQIDPLNVDKRQGTIAKIDSLNNSLDKNNATQ
jgi:hypothetical protein